MTRGGTTARLRLCSRVVANELLEIHRICRAIGEKSQMAAEIWALAILIGDDLAELQDLKRAIYTAALESGVTDEEWDDIRLGRND